MTGRIRDYLDDSVAEQDAATLSRLNRARHEALAHVGRQGWYRLRWPAIAMTACALLLVAVVPLLQQGNSAQTVTEAQAVEFLISMPDQDVVDELDFYLALGE